MYGWPHDDIKASLGYSHPALPDSGLCEVRSNKPDPASRHGTNRLQGITSRPEIILMLFRWLS